MLIHFYLQHLYGNTNNMQTRSSGINTQFYDMVSIYFPIMYTFSTQIFMFFNVHVD